MLGIPKVYKQRTFRSLICKTSGMTKFSTPLLGPYSFDAGEVSFRKLLNLARDKLIARKDFFLFRFFGDRGKAS